MDGCDKAHHGRGLCDKHYQRARARGTLQTRAEEIAERDRPSDDPAERAWAAGLFEGEGSVSPVNHNHNGRSYRYIRLTMQMTDEDVLRRFAAVAPPNHHTGAQTMRHFPHISAARTFYHDVTIEMTGDRGCGSSIEVEVEFTATPDTPAQLYGEPGDCYPAEAGDREIVSIRAFDYPREDLTGDGVYILSTKRRYFDIPAWMMEYVERCIDIREAEVEWSEDF